MIERFQGEAGKRRLLAALADQKLLAGIADAPEQLVAVGRLVQFQTGDDLITQGASDSDVFFLLSGSTDIFVNSKHIAIRHAGEQVGEMAAIEPSQPRSATVRARDTLVAFQVPEHEFIKLAHTFPGVWQRVAATLARRLAQRNVLIAQPRTQVRVFVMSSKESLPITRLMVQHFQHDPFLTIVWDHGVFRASNYTLEDLERQLETADFAIAVAHADDTIISRGDEWPTLRDNVVFELGMFIGFLGRRRAVLMEPREEHLRLPSDLTGLATVNYRYRPGPDAASHLAPACNHLRDLILAEGPRS